MDEWKEPFFLFDEEPQREIEEYDPDTDHSDELPPTEDDMYFLFGEDE